MIEHKENINSMKVGKIPIANIWLLMLYASDYYRSFGKRFSSVDEITDDIPDLIAKMLCREVKKKLRRNLTLGYIEKSDCLSRLRGKIDVLETKSKKFVKQRKGCLLIY
jgi:5-methylcytosine-specific restriction enzyme subunit McrC